MDFTMNNISELTKANLATEVLRTTGPVLVDSRNSHWCHGRSWPGVHFLKSCLRKDCNSERRFAVVLG